MERFQVASRAPFINLETGCLTAHGLKTMIALIQSTGGDASGIIPLPADIDLVETESRLNDLEGTDSLIALIPRRVISEFSVSSAHTTCGNEFVECTDSLTVTLNTTPDDGERVLVYHNAGNGKQISVTDGTGTDIMSFPETLVSYAYSVELAQWVRGA